MTPERAAELAAIYRERADQLDALARARRAEGDVNGPGAAEDAEQAACEYRVAAEDLELGVWA